MGGLSGLRFRKDAKTTAAEALSRELRAAGYEDVYLLGDSSAGFLHAEMPLNINPPENGERTGVYMDGHDQKYTGIKEAFGRCGLVMSPSGSDRFEIMSFCMVVSGIQGGGVLGMIHDRDVTGKRTGDPEELAARVGAFFTLHNKLELFLLRDRIPEVLPSLTQAAREAGAVVTGGRVSMGGDAALRAGRRRA